MNDNFPSPKLKASKWILFTTLVWFLGFALSLIIGIPTETLHIGNQFMLGVGMGAGVGIIQSILLAKFDVSRITWIWTSCLGLAIPYIIFDLIASPFQLKPETSLPFATALGSLLIGWFQYKFILKPANKRSTKWIICNALGWTIAHITLSLMNFISYRDLIQAGAPVFISVMIVLLFILCGGPILGIFSWFGIKDLSN